MKISIDKNLVGLTPENENERTELDKLWKILVDCVTFNRNLTPVGEYLPGMTDTARFAIEGGE